MSIRKLGTLRSVNMEICTLGLIITLLFSDLDQNIQQAFRRAGLLVTKAQGARSETSVMIPPDISLDTVLKNLPEMMIHVLMAELQSFFYPLAGLTAVSVYQRFVKSQTKSFLKSTLTSVLSRLFGNSGMVAKKSIR